MSLHDDNGFSEPRPPTGIFRPSPKFKLTTNYSSAEEQIAARGIKPKDIVELEGRFYLVRSISVGQLRVSEIRQTDKGPRCRKREITINPARCVIVDAESLT